MNNLLHLLIITILFCIYKGKITIISPPTLSNRFGGKSIPASYGNFGKISYGFSSRGKIIYNSEAQDNDPDYACKEEAINIEKNPLTEVDLYPIVLVKEGNCSFVQMTRNIQKAGGFMSIIISKDVETSEKIKKLSIKDDGSANDIVIPTTVISKQDGKIIEEFIKGNTGQSIILEVQFNYRKSDKVSLDLYMDTTNQEAYSFLSNFLSFYRLIKDELEFTPHFIAHQLEGLTEESKQNNCISNGKYCVEPYPLSESNNGKSLLLESLFQMCIYKLSSNKKETSTYFPELFMIFAGNYLSLCSFEDAYEKKCGTEILLEYGITVSQLEKCIAGTFGEEVITEEMTKKENSYFEGELKSEKSYIVTYSPTVVVNNKKIHGSINVLKIIEIICQSFNKEPQGCIDFHGPHEKSTPKFGWVSITLIIIGIIAINIIIVILCRKYIIKRVSARVEINELDLDGRINAVVSNYFALKEPGEK